MNFLNFITAAESLLNFKLSNHLAAPKQSLNDKPQTSAFKKVTSKDDQSLTTQLEGEKTEHYDQLMEERQRLINQYLQINIQILQKKMQDNEKTIEDVNSQEVITAVQKEKESPADPNKKKIKKVNNCGHEDRGHYAKGMCSNCYHRYGRVKKPWNCPHQKLYAAGMCQNCYINDYNRKKREEAIKLQDEIKDDSPTVKLIETIVTPVATQKIQCEVDNLAI